MHNLFVRQARSEDLSRVLEMVEGLAAYHQDIPMVRLDDLVRDCLGPNPWVTLLVAQKRDAILGYAALTPLVQLQFGVRGMDMHHLFVEAEARGLGVGRALISASVKTVRDLGCRYLTVGTHPDNKKAASVYLAAGFEALPPPGPRFRIKFDA